MGRIKTQVERDRKKHEKALQRAERKAPSQRQLEALANFVRRSLTDVPPEMKAAEEERRKAQSEAEAIYRSTSESNKSDDEWVSAYPGGPRVHRP